MPTSDPPAAHAVLEMIRERLVLFFKETCRTQYGIKVPVQCTPSGSQDAACTLRFHAVRSWHPEAHVRVQHVGGNVYDIVVDMEAEGPTCFTRSIPAEATDESPVVSRLGNAVGEHLLQQLERGVGRRTLQGQQALSQMRTPKARVASAPALQSAPHS